MPVAVIGARVDHVVTDVAMPGRSGARLARELWIERPSLPILFTSGYTEDEVAHRGIESTGSGQCTILVIEDEGIVRRLALRVLGAAGHTVMEARTAEEALRLWPEIGARVDHVVTDVAMPGRSGARLARELWIERPSLPILFTSGYTEDEVAHRGIESTGSGQCTILVIEDEGIVRRLALRVLGAAGHTVMEARTAEEALRLWPEIGARVDHVVTDVAMPGRSGARLARELWIERPSLPILFTSGYTEDEVAHRGIEFGAFSFLHKSCSSDSLLRGVQHTMAGEARPDTRAALSAAAMAMRPDHPHADNHLRPSIVRIGPSSVSLHVLTRQSTP